MMGRPKRKLSPIKSDAKLRKLSDIGFSKPKESACINDGVVGEIAAFEQRQSVESVEKPVDTPVSNRVILNPVRNFCAKWYLTRDWLEYDSVKKMMFCNVCIKAKVENSFTVGCTSLKKENIEAHENPKGKKIGNDSHSRALGFLKEVNECENARAKQLRGAEAAVIGALKNVAFMASHDLPNNLMEDLNQLYKDQGAVHLEALKCDNHTTYEHHSSVSEFQKAIAEVITDELVESINKSPYYSVTLDESTDITVQQNLIVYIVYLAQEKGQMLSKSRFLGLVNLDQGATAQHIFEALTGVLTIRGIDISKMCGVATDGAAVMTGHKSGVVKKLKDEIPGILSVHCIAHRLALSSGGAADSIMYLVKFQEIVNALYKYFEYSPKHSNKLKAMQEVLQQQQRLKMKQVFHTRWLSFDGALRAVLVNYSSILSVLLDVKSAKSAGLVKSMSCYKFLYTAHFLSDIMHHLCRLSKAFEEADINFSAVCPLLEYTSNKVKSLATGTGQNITSFLQSVPLTPIESNLISGQFEFEFGGHIMKDSNKQRKEAQQICIQFCDKVVGNLESRFDPTGDSAVLSAITNVFCPTAISKVHELEYNQAIKRDAKLISEHFQKVNTNTSVHYEINDFIENLHATDNKVFEYCKRCYAVLFKSENLVPSGC